MKTKSFQNGDTIPVIGLGTWLSKKNELHHAILDAIRAGYRHFDCAYVYQNEAEIGRAFKEAFSSGLVKREDVFITSKLWNSFHAPEDVELGIKKSLADLQLDYLDLYLIHWPIAFRKGVDNAKSADDLVSLSEMPLKDTWIAMNELKKKGLTKHIGISNFNIPKMQALMNETGIHPELNQIELHPYLQQDDVIEFCNKNNILVTAYSPLGGVDYVGTEKGLEKEAVILEIAAKHNCSATQVLLAWGTKRDTIIIPKSTNKQRIENNLNSINIELDAEDMQKIATLDRHFRTCKGVFVVFPGGAYTLHNIWEE